MQLEIALAGAYDDRHVRRLLERPDRLAPGRRGEHVHAAALEHAAQREDVAHVVVADEDPAAFEDLLAIARLLEQPLPIRRQLELDLV